MSSTTIEEHETVGSDVELIMRVHYFDGEACDTTINIEGEFSVAGCTRDEFADKLNELISEYQI